jgi:hypothetical protein
MQFKDQRNNGKWQFIKEDMWKDAVSGSQIAERCCLKERKNVIRHFPANQTKKIKYLKRFVKTEAVKGRRRRVECKEE